MTWDTEFQAVVRNLAEQIEVSVDGKQLNQWGKQALGAGFFGLARRSFRKALASGHSPHVALNNLGFAFESEEKYADAEKMYLLALEHAPNYELAANNLSNTLVKTALQHLTQDTASALSAVERLLFKSLSFDPDNDWAMLNLGNVHRKKNDCGKARSWFRWALESNPDNATAANNLAHLLLQEEELAAGFALYEKRFFSSGFPSSHAYFKDQRYWDGVEDLTGKHLLLHWEQGFGDMIQFVRYVFPLRQKYPTARITLECHPELVSLFLPLANPSASCPVADLPGQLPVIDQVVDNKRSEACMADVDLVYPLLSLARLFSPSVDAIPAYAAYLPAPLMQQQQQNHWRGKMAARAKRATVAISWAGRPTHANDKYRSLHLQQFLNLLPANFCQENFVISLQLGAAKQQLEALAPVNIEDASDDIQCFSDSAAILNHCDLFIGVDSANLHLAGALGIPAIGLIPQNSDWRWFKNRTNSPWYPWLQLVRQKNGEDWSAAQTSLREALKILGFE